MEPAAAVPTMDIVPGKVELRTCLGRHTLAEEEWRGHSGSFIEIYEIDPRSGDQSRALSLSSFLRSFPSCFVHSLINPSY